MRREYTPGGLLSLLPSYRRESPATTPFEAFRAQTFPHIDAVYSDAFCLTGNPEDAADLVVETYIRAFRRAEWFQRRRVPEHLRTRSTLAWLYGHLHAAFCDGILAQERPAGDRGD